ncbi:MAG TPA: hypothetical protein VJ623_15675 [Holophagaceae bacterium]|nr:hypothetical protein [Holophagaceae bacterium]
MQDANASEAALRKAVTRGRVLGLVLCLAWPLILMAMIGGGAVRAGTFQPVGTLRTVAFVLMGLSLLSGGLVTWRTNRVLGGFSQVPRADRPRVAFREIVFYSALFELSCVYGLVYWMLVGRNAFHHVLTFMALTPIMFFLFVPGLNDWAQASEGTRV